MSVKHSLSNNTFLSKIDQLRETNVGSLIPLPQVIVVGDQSSGKSSTLESLTGFAFPRAATLCTRYATQISCIRAPVKEIVVSIIPRPDASEELKARLQAFRHTMDKMDDESLATVFHEANTAMGIRMGADDDRGDSAFSEDTLKIDISGPDETHLTLIDVPGIFRVPTPGFTTDSDIQLVKSLVKRYMENPRTIILAVIPCNVDIVSQGILRLAAEADPDGVRTMGVLTKPDLAKERAVQNIILELLNGQRNPLKLGYCVLLNRGADDNSSSAAALQASEREFFRAPPWSTCSATALGSSSLQAHIRTLLLDICKRELPHVRAQIELQHKTCTEQLAALGPSRADEAAQRRHLVQVAARVQGITKSAVNGYYSNDNGLFQRVPALRLITKLVLENEKFSKTLGKKGHIQHFRKPSDESKGDDAKDQNGLSHSDGEDSDDDSEEYENRDGGGTSSGVDLVQHGLGDMDINADNDVGREKIDSLFPVSAMAYEELSDIVAPTKAFSPPSPGPLTTLIQKVYQSTRGPELGTYNGTVLATVFRTITTRWEPLILSHVSTTIMYVHDYMHALLHEVCPDQVLRSNLWDVLLRDELRTRYRSAISHSTFLINIERNGLPITLNHYFNSTVQHKRQERFLKQVQTHSQTINHVKLDDFGIVEHSAKLECVPMEELKNMSTNMDNSEHVCEDLLDAVESYYKVARKRFVDTLCQHVIYHMLLTGPDSPLKILSPDRIMTLSADQVEAIAGEDAVTLNQRKILGRKLQCLEEAMKVLRS